MMNYKTRLTLLFVGLFFVVLTSILVLIYISYGEFRRDEFFERLREKSYSTVKLLAEVKQIDKDLLKIIDQNTINKMYDEKVLVFNDKNELIYSSLDDEAIPYSTKVIDQIRTTSDKFYVDEDGDEVVGIHYREHGFDYVVLASAYDTYGISKLENLRNLIIVALLLGTVLIAFSSYFYIQQVFRPIDQLNESIQVINENNFQEFVTIKKNRDELDKLALNYNQMLSRLNRAFVAQKSFVRNASHELKTPLAVIQGKLEKLRDAYGNDEQLRRTVDGLMDDVDGQAALVESLLLMQRLQSAVPVNTAPIRIDDALEESVRDVKSQFEDLVVEVDIDASVATEQQLTVKANAMLLKICIKNLITNAALYTEPRKVRIHVGADKTNLILTFANNGDEPLPADLIFEPFYRQTREQEKPGSGLGLSIVSQIMDLMKGSVAYTYDDDQHIFKLKFPHL